MGWRGDLVDPEVRPASSSSAQITMLTHGPVDRANSTLFMQLSRAMQPGGSSCHAGLRSGVKACEPIALRVDRCIPWGESIGDNPGIGLTTYSDADTEETSDSDCWPAEGNAELLWAPGQDMPDSMQDSELFDI